MSPFDNKRSGRTSIKIVVVIALCLFAFWIGMHSVLHIDLREGPVIVNNPIKKILHKKEGPLLGKTFVVDAGHGGSDPGTISTFNQIYEAELNMIIANQVKESLEQLGGTVVMTRTDESTLELASENSLSLRQRGEIILEVQPDMVISVHQNYNKESSDIEGVQMLIRRPEFASMAEQFQESFNSQLGYKLKYLRESYAVLGYGHQPGFILECGFLSNYEDELRLQTKVYQAEIVKILSEEIVKYFKQINDLSEENTNE